MPSARASRRGFFLNCRFAVNGIQKADCSRPALAVKSARLFIGRHYTVPGRDGDAAAQRPVVPATSLARVGDDLLLLLAEALDAERHHVAGLEKHRGGLDA